MNGAKASTVEFLKNAEYTTVKLAKLVYDDKNPRLGGEVQGRSPKHIQRFLEGSPHYAIDLVDSIVDNGFIPYEPLVVRKEGDKFVVIEGNRRLAAVQHIVGNAQKYDPNVIDRLQKIPVLVFHERADKTHLAEIQTYLGVKHLFKFRDWPPLSKAIFLDKRIKTEKDVAALCRELGIPKSEIARWVIPYRLRKKAPHIFENVRHEDFWYLAESFQRGNFKPYIELDVDRKSLKIRNYNKEKLRYLAEFLYGRDQKRKAGGGRAKGMRRISDTRQLGDLNRVLGSSRASRKLEKGSTLEDALLYVEPKEQSVKDLIKQLDRVLKKILMLSPAGNEAKAVLRHLRSFQKTLKARARL